jgi:tetratricopeptide (TPR) repeat protein
MSQTPITQSQAPEPIDAASRGASQPNVDGTVALEGTVKRLRAELAGAVDKSRQARLLSEIGEIEERTGDEPGAARDYLAAFNVDPTFREPLEGLVRLLERRRSLKNLGRLVDALARAATTPEEKARALLTKGAYLEDVSADLDGAKNAVREATQVDAPILDAAAAWLSLELVAAKTGDTATREEALAERIKSSIDPTWRGLLLIDAAKVATSLGDVDRALGILEEARAIGGAATYSAALAIERLARKEAGLVGSDEARTRGEAHAASLETQGRLLFESTANPDRGNSLGVPLWARNPTMIADAWLRAARLRRGAGEIGKAAQILDRAREALSNGEMKAPGLVDAAIATERVRIAELMGDTALAAELAASRLEKEEDGGVAASLAMRVAEHAANSGDGHRALEALSRAIERDPASLPARALQLDLLADGGDATTFASQLESFADHLATDEARGRAFILAAWIWGVRAGDTSGAKAALSQASMYGVAPGTVARLARAMAAVRGDTAWYEDATKRLVSSGAGEEEVVPLLLELYRARAARGEIELAAKSLREIGNAPKGAWLGRVLEAFAPERFDPERTGSQGDGARRRVALDELAALESDPDVSRGLTLIAAMRAHALGDVESARRRLGELAANDPGDVLVATYLGDVERGSGAHAAAATVAAATAEATDDRELSATLWLEAGFERWRDGDRRAALDAFEAARAGAPEVAKVVLAWATRGVDVDSIEGRRRAIERAVEAGGDTPVLSLERFATEIGGGDPDDAAAALTALDRDATGDLSVAGSLARLAWPAGAADADAFDAACARIGALGDRARSFAAAERARVARESGDVADAARTAHAWVDAGGGLVAGIEWLAASIALAQPSDERAAREAVARMLTGESRDAFAASAALVDGASQDAPFVVGDSAAVRFANLELAPPGCDARRRATALVELDTALGDDAKLDALALAGWSALAAGELPAARAAWEKVAAARPDDLAAWEGLRTCGELQGDRVLRANAASELGVRCAEASRGAAFSEEAALLFLDLGEEALGEAALDASFARDATRGVAFDRLFRRVRERKESDRLLALISRRLDATDEPKEIAKLFWEQARVLREKGDQEAALKALEHVTMLEPDHIGALALTGEIALKRGLFDEAATALARLATLDAAPPKNRITAGVAAVDIYENKLDRFDKALEVLLALHQAKLSTLPVRERLARAAARTGSWKEATSILEELMNERVEGEGRVEAARLAMAIHRDRLSDPAGARAAIVKLLQEAPSDGEALDMLLATEHPAEVRTTLLKAARAEILEKVAARPLDPTSVRRLAKVARALGDEALQQAALTICAVVAPKDPQLEQQLAQLAAKKPRTPQTAVTQTLFKSVLAAGDEGAIADLFGALGPTLAEALGPSLQACGVTKRDKVDPRSGIALRNEIASWAGAFGVTEFDLYVGGKDDKGVQGIPGEVPAIVVGSAINAPLSAAARARIAREVLAIVRGTTVARTRDDVTVAAVVVAACHLAEVRVDSPPYAVLAEVEKLVSKAIPRKTKKLLSDLCRGVVSSGVDARAWSKRALLSQSRVALVASGDAAVVLADLLGVTEDKLPTAVKGDSRAEELARFVLSPSYLDIRRSLGLEGSQ